MALEPVLRRCRCRWWSTTARIDPAEGTAGAAYAALRRLLERGSTWVKLSGAYMRSAVHGPSYADTLPLGRAPVQAVPERLVWGSDWPHTTEAAGTVNDADLMDLLHAWAGSAARWNASWWTIRRACTDSSPPREAPRKPSHVSAASPQVREFECFTAMPESLPPPRAQRWAGTNRGGAVADSFLEGRCSTTRATST